MKTEIHRTALVLISAEKLYDLINDIESYPQFLDGVVSAKIREQSDSEMVGELTLKKTGIQRTIVTRNKLTAPSRIEMTLEEGPLQSLRGVWQIKSLGDSGCKVSLDLSFEAGGGLKAIAFGAVFKQIADKMVESFVSRAAQSA